MRKTRTAYHYAIHMAKRAEHDNANQRFAEAILQNRSRDSWGEVKRIRRAGTCCSSNVDGLTGPDDIANSFAARYQDLYTSVPYVMSDMAKIRNEIEHSITGFDNNCVIDVCEVLQAVRRLKPGKSDGYVGLTSDYFLHACNKLCVHVAILFTGLLVHSCIPEDLSIFLRV